MSGKRKAKLVRLRGVHVITDSRGRIVEVQCGAGSPPVVSSSSWAKKRDASEKAKDRRGRVLTVYVERAP